MKDIIRRRRSHPLGFFDEMRDFFKSFYEDLPSWDDFTSWPHEYPAVDVREEKDRYRIEADLPGMTEKDVEVRVDNDVLTIASKKEEKMEEKKEGYLMRERRSASFRRRFRIPSDVDQDKINANFKEGILSLDLPRTGSAKSKLIEVKKQ
jgi:HSP20 family protein